MLNSELPLTVRQRQCLDYIKYRIAFDFPPTVRELADELDVHVNAITQLLRRLERKGYITIGAFQARAIQLTEPSQPLTQE